MPGDWYWNLLDKVKRSDIFMSGLFFYLYNIYEQ